jgi:monothiol glutaredoxin
VGCNPVPGYIYEPKRRPANDPGRAEGLAIRNANMSIEQFIDNEVKSNDVVLFMKGTPQFPQCGFSGQVVQILDHVGIPYKGLNVLESGELRDGIKIYSNWPTIPQLYVKGEFVGGCDIIREMFQAGELQQLFADKGIGAPHAAG